MTTREERSRTRIGQARREVQRRARRETEISELLQVEGLQYLIAEHERLEVAATTLRQNWSCATRVEYDIILTSLNHDITELTDLTDPSDLEIARRLIKYEADARNYAEAIEGTGMSDSS